MYFFIMCLFINGRKITQNYWSINLSLVKKGIELLEYICGGLVLL